MPSRLAQLKMSELAGVDHGANLLDGFLVMKQLTPEQRAAVLKAAEDMQATHEDLYEAIVAIEGDMSEAPQDAKDALAVLKQYCEETLGEGDNGLASQQLDAVDETEKADKTPYGDVEYADPGYQDDKKKRYPLDTEEHIRAAWGYINQEDNKGKYSAADYKKVRAKVAAAMKKIGAEVEKARSIKDLVLDLFKRADGADDLVVSADDLREALGLTKAQVIWGGDAKSYDTLRGKVSEALCDVFPSMGGYNECRAYVSDLTPDSALICDYSSGESKYWVASYATDADGDVQLAPLTEWQAAQQAWVTSSGADE